MLIPVLSSVAVAVTAAFDGYETNRAQKLGAAETGIGNMIFGIHPMTRDLIVKGGLVIAAEIALLQTVGYFVHGSVVFSIPLLVQSVFHIIGGIGSMRLANNPVGLPGANPGKTIVVKR